jgi:glycerophosphoryl diester phosphodiesterase
MGVSEIGTNRRPKVVAHRGFWWPDVAQNSRSALLRAEAEGADGVEVDVRMTLDGELVLCHDKSYHKVEIAAVTLRRIWEDTQNAPLEVPLLVEAFEGYGGSVNLEIKRDSRQRVIQEAHHLAEVLKEPFWEGLAQRKALILSSFDPETLVILGQVVPEIPRFFLLDRYDPTRKKVALAKEIGCVGVNLHHQRASTFALDLCRQSDMEVGLWTLDDPVRADNFCYPAVSNIITNRVDLLVGNL